jgi:hypothetical protein
MSAIAAAVIVGVGAVAGGVMAYQGAKEQGKAAKAAAEMQATYGMQAIDAETARFLEMKQLIQPYTEAGYKSLTGQQDLIGQNGPEAQQKAIDAIQNGANFFALEKFARVVKMSNMQVYAIMRGESFEEFLATRQVPDAR